MGTSRTSGSISGGRVNDQSNLDGGSSEFDLVAICKPIVKYPGGKRALLPKIVPKIQAHLRRTGGNYIEPFLGGAAVAIALSSHASMQLSDVNQDLIALYQSVVRWPELVAEKLDQLAKLGTEGDTYNHVRAQFNEPSADAIQRAATMLYLNRTCFNGLWRVNSKGKFNVPCGRYKSPSFPSRADLILFAATMRHAVFQVADFRSMILSAQAGDVVYADPPYDSTFDKYAEKGFGKQAQLDLASQLKTCADRGVLVCASNADTEYVRSIYSWAKITEVEERRAINNKGDGRAPVKTLLIWSI